MGFFKNTYIMISSLNYANILIELLCDHKTDKTVDMVVLKNPTLVR